MNLTPIHITNPDWQAYNTLCLKLFNESPIRKLDATGLKMTPSTFLGSTGQLTNEENIATSIHDNRAKHIFLGFGMTNYIAEDVIILTQCAGIAISEIEPGLILATGSLKDWFDATICLSAKNNPVGAVIYMHLARAGFDSIFRDFERVREGEHVYIKSKNKSKWSVH